jgi:ribosomal protein S10
MTCFDQNFRFLVHHRFFRITLIAKTCTCHKYLEEICKHLIAACIAEKISLSGLVQLPKKFQIIRRKKNRNYIDAGRSQEQMEAAMVEIP